MIDDILKELEFNGGKLPEDALRKAIECQEEITPALIRVIDDTWERAYKRAGQYNFVGHLTAMYLLAQFREKRAYRPIVRFFSLPEGLAFHLAGDFVFDDLPRVLASVCGGDLSLIKRLIEDPEIDPTVRGAAVRALLGLLATESTSRLEVVAYFRSLFDGKLERVQSEIWGELISACVDIHPAEFVEDIMKCFDEDIVDVEWIDRDEVTVALDEDKRGWLERLRENPYLSLIDDAMVDAAWCYDMGTEPLFDDDDDDEYYDEDWEDENWEGDNDFDEFPEPWLLEKTPDSEVSTNLLPFEQAPKSLAKIGRNEPCPCGSGKKFKKCCGDPKLQDRD